MRGLQPSYSLYDTRTGVCQAVLRLKFIMGMSYFIGNVNPDGEVSPSGLWSPRLSTGFDARGPYPGLSETRNLPAAGRLLFPSSPISFGYRLPLSDAFPASAFLTVLAAGKISVTGTFPGFRGEGAAPSPPSSSAHHAWKITPDRRVVEPKSWCLDFCTARPCPPANLRRGLLSARGTGEPRGCFSGLGCSRVARASSRFLTGERGDAHRRNGGSQPAKRTVPGYRPAAPRVWESWFRCWANRRSYPVHQWSRRCRR